MSSNSAPISVVIPAYRAADTIERTLRSILNQGEVRPRILVVVEGADEAISRILSNYPVSVLVNEKPKGAQKARNIGLAAVETEFVTFVDSDDYIQGDLHVGVLDTFDRTGCDLIFSPWTYEGREPPLHLHGSADFANFARLDRLILAWAGGTVSKTGAMTWRTEALRAIGGWDPLLTRLQDVEIGLRSLACGLSYAFSTEGKLVYVLHDADHRVTARSWDEDCWSFERLFSVIELAARGQPNAAEIREAAAQWSFRLAANAFMSGHRQAGRTLLDIARRHGRPRYGGSILNRVATHVLGLERRIELSRRLRGAR